MVTYLTDISHSEKVSGMKDGTIGSFHSWELVTSVDGPGTRLTLFVNGCPLRCLYCHNPDTMKMKDGNLVSVEEIGKLLRRYSPTLKATNGGLTLSGGEILMQAKFAFNLLKEAKKLHLHTALDTSGFLGLYCTQDMLDLTDLVLLDIKSGNEETYKKVTGRSLQPTIDFGERLVKNNKKMWIRFVLVPGLTDDEQNIRDVADLIKNWNTVERVEVLPFHQMGKEKWHELSMPYLLEETLPPTSEVVEFAKNIFKEYGLPVK